MEKEQMNSEQELMGQANAGERKHEQVMKLAVEQEDVSEAEQIYQIFDKVFKKMITLSTKKRILCDVIKLNATRMYP